MGEDIITNPVVLVELAKDLATDLKKINDLNDAMGADLKALGASFQDEDYDKVKGSVAKIQGLINEALPEVGIVSEKLIIQAELLQKQINAMNG